MTYIPGMIAILFGVYELVRALFAKSAHERKGRFLRAGIDFAIGAALIYLNVTVLNRPT